MRLFVPLVKVDKARREVWGRLTEEVADNAGEIFDYATSKKFFQEWSDDFKKSTAGNSLGNLRAMHGEVAAGKLIAIDFNDAEKAIDIGTRVVDDNEWKKVDEFVYTGFSVGGRYVKKWVDGALMRYTAKPSEASLVDKPCVPTAKFCEVIKMDGTKVSVALRTELTPEQVAEHNQKVEKRARELAATAFALLPITERSGGLTQEQFDKLSKADQDKALRPADGNWEAHVAEATRQLAKDDGEEEDDDLEKPEGVPQEEWDKMSRSEKEAAIEDESEKSDRAKKEADELAKASAAGASTTALSAVEELASLLDSGKVTPTQLVELAKREFTQEQRDKSADKGHAMPDGGYPIENREDLKNAVQAYGRAKDKEATKKHIIEQAKRLDATDELPADWESSTKDKEEKKADGGALRKGLYNVQSFAQALMNLGCIFSSARQDLLMEGDNSPVPGALRSWLAQGAEIFKTMAAEEVDELIEELGETAMIEVAAFADRIDVRKRLHDPELKVADVRALAKEKLTTEELSKIDGGLDGPRIAPLFDALVAKYGARHSKEDLGHLQTAHDSLVKCGAMCKADAGAEPGRPGADVQQAPPGGQGADTGNQSATVATTEKTDAGALLKALQSAEVTELKNKLTEALERIGKLEKTPVPIKGVLRAIGKNEDLGDAESKTPSAEDELIKAAKPGEHNPPAAFAMIKKAVTETAPLRKV